MSILLEETSQLIEQLTIKKTLVDHFDQYIDIVKYSNAG